jgi:ATP-dependent Lon protease
MVLHFDVGRDKSIAALDEAMISNQVLFLATQRDTRNDDPSIEDIYEVGTVSRIKQMLKMPGDTIRVLVEGLNRGRVVRCLETTPYFEVEIEEADDNPENRDALEEEALMRSLLNIFEDYVRLSNKASPETLISVNAVQNPGQLADVIAANVLHKTEDKQAVLDAFEISARLRTLYDILAREIQILEIEKKINLQVKNQMDKMQRDYYLREQLKAIHKELGTRDDLSNEADEYKDKILKAGLPEEAYEKAMRETDRLAKTPLGSAETGIIRTYLDWILDMPWNSYTEDNLDLKKAAAVLAEEHYGLDKVKERIIEFLAVHQLTKNMKGPILCFVGPPGVGKTSIARSIAHALNRKFIRMSLGGVRDEAEIRGHRRTYVGAIPGRVISSIKLAGSKNPVFLFDEVDKMSSDFRGDPASALLEVLDAEQNYAFRDHYLEIPFDLSKIMFLTTANSLETIPRALLDRLEVIRIAGYTDDEKINISKRHLIPKQASEHGLNEGSILLPDSSIVRIITDYTREAGVRSLERQIASICRKAARIVVETSKKQVKISSANINKYLGTPVYRYDKVNRQDEVGLVTGLAWTVTGGETLSIEAIPLKGTGKLVLTGHLGEVMKESARAGFSYIRAKADMLGINPDFYNNTDIHIHIPEGAIPKDGPSAGVAMTIATISALTAIPVRKDVAMTGEITLRGRVLAIGGLKEKVLAAHRAGVSTVLIPSHNAKDLDEIPDNIKRSVKIIAIDHMDNAIEQALVTSPQLKQPIEGEKTGAEYAD